MTGAGWRWIALLWVELVTAAVVIVLLAGGEAGVRTLIASMVWSAVVTIGCVAILRACTGGRGGR